MKKLFCLVMLALGCFMVCGCSDDAKKVPDKPATKVDWTKQEAERMQQISGKKVELEEKKSVGFK